MEVMAIARQQTKLKCYCCGEERGLKEFYRASSSLYQQNGKMLVCKHCIKRRYEQLLAVYKGDKVQAFKHTLMNFDVYFDLDLYNVCVKKEDNFVGEYFRLLATKERRDKTSIDNIMDGDSSATGLISDELVLFWGRGYDYESYMSLERKYENYIKYYPSESMQEKQIIKTLCELEVQKEKSIIKGDTNEQLKINDQISKKMAELDIIPSKAKKYGEDKDLVFGKLIEMIEKDEPIPDVHQEFKDVDRILYWLNRYFISPMKKVFGLEPAIYTEEDEIYDPPSKK